MNSLNMNNYTYNIEDLSEFFDSKKGKYVRFLKKNFKYNIHYIIDNNINKNNKKHGGHNKIIYMLTEETFNLIKCTFNIKHRYITAINDTKIKNIIMSLENQTIGFIHNSFINIIDVKRQFPFDKYKVDLYFPLYKLVVECDENNHEDREPNYEMLRENYIISTNNSIIRFNPNDNLFDLSIVLREINKILFSNKKVEPSIIKVMF